jgi:hypothetical protein
MWDPLTRTLLVLTFASEGELGLRGAAIAASWSAPSPARCC